MNKTPNSNRKHITIFGKTNAGKSSLLNAVTEQSISIVSDIPGTTTDSVVKAMELIPYGPVLFIDSAGLDDSSELGSLRVQKALSELKRTDFALYLMDCTDLDVQFYESVKKLFKEHSIGHKIVMTKTDKLPLEEIESLKLRFPEALFTSSKDRESILRFKSSLIESLQKEEEDPGLLEGILEYGSRVIMVVPIDSEAPKGRLILPQVQLIRECLDQGIKSYVVRDTELESALEDMPDVDLVVTDSQAFSTVKKIVGNKAKLTSFSILFANQKGKLDTFVKGIESIDKLEDGDKILVLETCTHNTSHEDIGRVKIPALLKKKTGKNLEFNFCMGKEFPENLKEYKLILHCGGCMLTRRQMLNRLYEIEKNEIPVVNYGVILAHLTGILDASLEVFNINRTKFLESLS